MVCGGIVMSQMYLPGATTIGIICKDGVVLASEKRVSYGYTIMSKAGKKLFIIIDHIGAACAGLVADMQILTRQVSAYAKLFELNNGRRISVKAASKTMSNLLFQRRFFPYFTQTIVGGIDDEGPSLYTLDPMGSLIPDKYATIGSGAQIAVGVLEESYREGLTLEEGRDLALRAMRSAIKRDIASGNGIDLLLISKDEIREENLTL